MNNIYEPDDQDIHPRILFPVGVLITLVLAYLLDRWLFSQTRLAQSTGNQYPLILWTAVSGFVLFATWLALSWIALTRSRRSTPVSIIILIIGLLLYLYPYLQLLVTWLPMLFFTVRTPLTYTGLFIAVLSILQLIVKSPSRLRTRSE